MKKKTIFTGAGVAIITPMQADGTVDHTLLTRLVDEQIQGGTDAIVICGTTGEAATLTDEEHIATIGTAVKAAAGRVPVVAGTGANDTAHSLRLATAARDLGADALLLVTPYYNKTTQAGLIPHFLNVVDKVGLPAILYNVPSRTGMNIEPTTVKKLAEHPLVCGIKEASGNISQVATIRQMCGDDINVYSGNDDQIVPILSLGGKGVISVLSNVAPRQTHDICRLWFEGKTQESLELQLKLLPLVHALFCEVNPIPVKEAMNQLGFPAGPCRLPLVPVSEAHRQLIHDELQAAGLLK